MMVSQIAFVGLMVPHIVRYLVGTIMRVIPLTAVVGGLLLVADTVAHVRKLQLVQLFPYWCTTLYS